METPLTHPVIHTDIPPSDNDVGWDAQVRFDSNELCWEFDDEEDKSEDEGLSESEGDGSDGLHVGLMVLAIEIGDDPQDEDWIPKAVQRKQNSRIAKGKISMKWKPKLLLKSYGDFFQLKFIPVFTRKVQMLAAKLFEHNADTKTCSKVNKNLKILALHAGGRLKTHPRYDQALSRQM
jgi:hypothetical protein